MSRLLVLIVSVGLALLACSRRGEARVRLNSIRTVILRGGHPLPGNRSAWEPSMDLTLYQCMSDLECSEGSYCHIPTKGPVHSRCQTCRRRNRRCHRDGMCCPGNRCSSNVCVPDVDSFMSQRIPDTDEDISPLSGRKGWRKRGRMDIKGSSSKGQVGDSCLRSSDCSDNLCCARHFWTRICKPVLREGQVCTRQRRKGHHGLELFQRCPCGAGLSCRTLRDLSTQPSTPSSSSMLAPKPKSAVSSSSSRHSSPHTSVLSSTSSSSSSVVSKTRLHVCHTN
ncbi:dickkopf-related protein 2-like [Melanotaenia boesemani]|uniref:dickkopf-related protein 2-like n=1 Tax=Melanotaenia boesemani TaxID=1250792 RepID=UPI001C0594FE|nr:dickkopf-related protein 2-like [Melanotaenia boesemani]XP_041842216.1 dickkopf-related protein 2-like [Melanotaenia boesemani]